MVRYSSSKVPNIFRRQIAAVQNYSRVEATFCSLRHFYKVIPILVIVALLYSSAQAAISINTVDSVGNVGFDTSLELDAFGYPVISYTEYFGALKLVHCNDAICSGGDDSIVTVDNGVNYGWKTSLALDEFGYPVITYMTNSLVLKLVHCNDVNCSGEDESILYVDDTSSAGYESSLVLDSSGFPVISYYDTEYDDLRLARCNDSICASVSISIVDSIDSVGRGSSLKLDSSGFPVISYLQREGEDPWSLLLAHCNDSYCVGGDESIVFVDIAGSEFLAGTSLMLDSSGFPVISYLGGTDRLKLVHCDDPYCLDGDDSIVTLDNINSLRHEPSLAIDNSGFPVISYYDKDNEDLRLAHCNDPNCTGGDESNVFIESAGSVGAWNSLELDSSGFPVISYYDAGNGDLKLSHCDSIHCGPEIDLQGNTLSITNGDSFPSTSDNTDFGYALVESGTVTHTFTIKNYGDSDLILPNNPRVFITGLHAADFTLTSDASTPITSGGQTTFQIAFDPSELGLRHATIIITNNDADENPYNFSIQGKGTMELFLPLILR